MSLGFPSAEGPPPPEHAQGEKRLEEHRRELGTLENRHLYLEDLRYRWVECLLGAIVIAVVTSTLILQRSVTASAGERVHELAHELGKNMLVVPADAEESEAYMLRYGDAAMPDDYPERIHSSPLSSRPRWRCSVPPRWSPGPARRL